MAYSAASDVAALTRNLLGSASEFDTSTSPTLAEVNAWLSSGCSLVNAVVAGRGYGAIPASSDAYDFARQANALYAAWMAERSRVNTRVADNERTRADMFRKDFESQLGILKLLDLSRLGVTQTGTAYAGGISKSDVDTVESDTDRVKPRFVRGMLRNVEALGSGEQERSTSEE